MIPIYSLQSVSEPPPEIIEALDPVILAKLRVKHLPGLRLVSPSSNIDCSGWCISEKYMEKQEINVVYPYRKNWAAEGVLITYIHETAHFLLQKYKVVELGGSHGPVFFALNLLLFVRAGEKNNDENKPFWHSMTLYDLQDFDLLDKDEPYHSIGQAIGWAWRQAHELAPQDISAEKCAEILSKRYNKWLYWLAEAPDRAEARAARHQAAKDERQALKNALEIAKKEVWEYSFYFFLGGAAIVAIIILMLL